jgi:GT2 family glycosyltransferase
VSRPDVSAVVVHHRGLSHLLDCLAALEPALSGLSGEIVLVDNTGGSPLGEVFRRHPRVRHVPTGRNAGFAAGCRIGAQAATGPLLLLVNDDATVAPEAPARLVSALTAAAPDVVAAAGRLSDAAGEKNDFSDGFLTFDGHAFADRAGAPLSTLPAAAPGEERLFACGGLMAVRREEFLSSGAFDDDYFAYLEDVDFGWRQWIFGRRIIAEPRATARHHGGATGTALGIYARGFLFEKNAFATAYKNFDAEHFRALMPSVLAAFLFRVAEMLVSRNPGAAAVRRDPYESPDAPPSLLRRLLGISEPSARAVTLEDPLTAAHLRALLWIHRHHDRLAAKRRAVQGARRRSDAEIFAKFPLRMVPTYPGDELFQSDFFREILPRAPQLVRTTLEEIFAAGVRP